METMWIRGENGVLHEMSLPLSPHIERRVERGDLVHVNKDGTPWTGDDDGDDEEPAATLPDAPPLPKKTENRAVWTEFAISQGMDRETAANMTKAELIETLTGSGDSE